MNPETVREPDTTQIRRRLANAAEPLHKLTSFNAPFRTKTRNPCMSYVKGVGDEPTKRK